MYISEYKTTHKNKNRKKSNAIKPKIYYLSIYLISKSVFQKSIIK